MIIYNIFRKNREIRIILNYNTQKLITTPLQNLQNKTKKNRILRFILQYPLTIQIMFVLLRTDLFVFLRTIYYLKKQKQTDLISRNSNKKRIRDWSFGFDCFPFSFSAIVISGLWIWRVILKKGNKIRIKK